MSQELCTEGCCTPSTEELRVSEPDPASSQTGGTHCVYHSLKCHQLVFPWILVCADESRCWLGGGCTWKGAFLGKQHPWPHVPLQDSAQLFLTAGALALKDEVNVVLVLGWWLDLVILKVLSNLHHSVFLRRVFQALERSCVIEGKGSAVCHLWSVKDGESRWW